MCMSQQGRLGTLACSDLIIDNCCLSYKLHWWCRSDPKLLLWHCRVGWVKIEKVAAAADCGEMLHSVVDFPSKIKINVSPCKGNSLRRPVACFWSPGPSRPTSICSQRSAPTVETTGNMLFFLPDFVPDTPYQLWNMFRYCLLLPQMDLDYAGCFDPWPANLHWERTVF